jgi:hypothetical protein
MGRTIFLVQLKDLGVRVAPHLQRKEPPSREFGEEGAWDGIQGVEVNIVHAASHHPEDEPDQSVGEIVHRENNDLVLLMTNKPHENWRF